MGRIAKWSHSIFPVSVRKTSSPSPEHKTTFRILLKGLLQRKVCLTLLALPSLTKTVHPRPALRQTTTPVTVSPYVLRMKPPSRVPRRLTFMSQTLSRTLPPNLST